ncbi:MAG: HAMP domain-containing sensor histidine kinase [Arenicellales bacterium]|nr:HAMP domain-containing sensor histidine kinase [Arenicellales bacterium]MDP6552594.1 HAMP domain-containing sensor histidine kinase [Arenicellales bacterium]MDP6791796.1 HAMP domain-containing sensor histidine kinase [Arenicellales bacterium]MDP6919757.1 HAMP domain-containing sensor histidine kinase [Arenicellales bacterium]
MNQNSFLASSTFRLALLYVILFTVSVLVLFSFIYWSSARYMGTQSDAAIRSEIATLAERYESRGVPGLRRLILDRITRQQPTGSSLYLLSDPLGRPIVGNISRWPQVIPDDGWLNFNLDARDRDDPGLHPARARRFQLTGGFQLLVGQDIQELKAAQRRVIIALSWGVILTVLLGLAGGFFISRKMLARLEVINETSQRIIAGELKHRVPVSARGDEFDRLSGNLNQMLDQIQELMDGIRQVSDNIAHDLKTPLFRLRQKLESLTGRPSSDAGHREELEDALAEADRLLNLFNALLRIARIESESTKTVMQRLPLSELANDVAEFYEPLADEKHQNLTVSAEDAVVIMADRDMLFQALANLVDNAAKYTPLGGNINLMVSAEKGEARITVCDSGPGIAPGEREKVFQRFYRTDVSRSTPGNGLGLSLVRAVAKLHNAKLTLHDNHPGLCVELALPCAPEELPV